MSDVRYEVDGRIARITLDRPGAGNAITQDAAGVEFKVNSTPQLRTVLFDKLGLAPQKKTKTGFSTDAQSLEKLKGQHPIIDKLLRYREVEKLRSTYGEGLLEHVGPDEHQVDVCRRMVSGFPCCERGKSGVARHAPARARGLRRQ